jgi:predicted N-acetyltransferase YhbS
MRIRPASVHDLNALQQISERLVLAATAGRYSIAELGDLAAKCSANTFVSAIANGCVFVAIDDADDRRLSGLGVFDVEAAVIQSICVPPEYEGQRVGRALVRECLVRARRSRSGKVEVTCIQDIAGFYGRLGFEVVGESLIALPDGSRLKQVTMSRPVEHPSLKEQIAGLEESVRFFASGQENQRAQDRYVVETFLRGLGEAFTDDDIVIPDQDPPDVKFRDANFEVKELYPEGRRRHQEYKDALAKARQAFWPDELLTTYSPRDILLSEVVDQVKQLGQRYVERYARDTRCNLDLLVYANLQHVERIIGTSTGDLAGLQAQGWRSVSFVRGSSTSCVLTASELAPEFVQRAKGSLLIAGKPSSGGPVMAE